MTTCCGVATRRFLDHRQHHVWACDRPRASKLYRPHARASSRCFCSSSLKDRKEHRQEVFQIRNRSAPIASAPAPPPHHYYTIEPARQSTGTFFAGTQGIAAPWCSVMRNFDKRTKII